MCVLLWCENGPLAKTTWSSSEFKPVLSGRWREILFCCLSRLQLLLSDANVHGSRHGKPIKKQQRRLLSSPLVLHGSLCLGGTTFCQLAHSLLNYSHLQRRVNLTDLWICSSSIPSCSSPELSSHMTRIRRSWLARTCKLVGKWGANHRGFRIWVWRCRENQNLKLEVETSTKASVCWGLSMFRLLLNYCHLMPLQHHLQTREWLKCWFICIWLENTTLKYVPMHTGPRWHRCSLFSLMFSC